VVRSPEVADDGRQRSRDDRLVERREQHSRHDRDEHEVHAAAIELLGLGRLGS
jgi:hypothetical protein